MRNVMEFICHTADWPIALRSERLQATAEQLSKTPASASTLGDSRSYLRHAMEDSVRLLRDGGVLVVFPEAYPTIDPHSNPGVEHHPLLAFRPGFARLVEMAEKDGQTKVAIIPAGFSYIQNGRWNVTLRFGPALPRSGYSDATHLAQDVEMRVRELSGESTSTVSRHAEETKPYNYETSIY